MNSQTVNFNQTTMSDTMSNTPSIQAVWSAISSRNPSPLTTKGYLAKVIYEIYIEKHDGYCSGVSDREKSTDVYLSPPFYFSLFHTIPTDFYYCTGDDEDDEDDDYPEDMVKYYQDEIKNENFVEGSHCCCGASINFDIIEFTVIKDDGTQTIQNISQMSDIKFESYNKIRDFNGWEDE